MLLLAVIFAFHVLAVANAAGNKRWNAAINLHKRFPITPSNSTCIQPMNDHPALPLNSSLVGVNAVENACNLTQTEVAKVELLHNVYTHAGSMFFNISRPTFISDGLPLNASSCQSIFNGMIAKCLENNYWGGWQLVQGNNCNSQRDSGQWLCLDTGSESYQYPNRLRDCIQFISLWINAFSKCFSSTASIGGFGLQSTAFGASSKQTIILNTSPTPSTSSIIVGPINFQSIEASTSSLLSSHMSKLSVLSGTTTGPGAVGTISGVAGSQSTSSTSGWASSALSGTAAGSGARGTKTSIPGSQTTMYTSSQANSTQSIIPDSSISNAFAFPGVSTTTLSASNGAVLIYTKDVFSDRATITGPPIYVQTSLAETLKDGHTTTSVGGIWVGPGGVYWGPPGIPNIESGGIKPPCSWPFCSGRQSNGGGGGGAPGGIPPIPGPPAPPKPHNNDDPKSQDNPSSQKQTKTSDKSTPSSSDRQTSTTHSTSSSRSSTSSSSSSSSSSSILSTVSLNEDPGLWPIDQIGQQAARTAVLADTSVSINDGPLWAPSGTDESSDAADALLTYSYDDGDLDFLTQIVSNSTRSTSFVSSATSKPSLTSSPIALAPASFISPGTASKTMATTLVTTSSSSTSAAVTSSTVCTLNTYTNTNTILPTGVSSNCVCNAGHLMMGLETHTGTSSISYLICAMSPFYTTMSTLPQPPAPRTTTTSIRAPLPPPPPPPPPKPTAALIIYREDTCDNLNCYSYGFVYDIAPGASIDPCQTGKSTYFYHYGSDVKNNNDNYAINMGPFNTHGIKSVKYTGTSKTVGRLTGAGLPGGGVQCINPTAENPNWQALNCTSSHSLQEDNETPVAYCEW